MPINKTTKTDNKMATSKSSKTQSNETAQPKSDAPKSESKTVLVIARKITLKAIQKMPLSARARIGGTVTKTETVTTQYGDSTRFLGNFAMKLTASGKWDDTIVTRAGAAFLPRAAENILAAGLAAKVNDPSFAGLDFAIEVRKIESTASKTGYEYEVSSLIAPAESEDKILALLA